MKITENQKQEVRKYIRKWRDLLFLHQWRFDTAYVLDDNTDIKGILITMNPEYKNALIEINVKNFFHNIKDKEEREEIMVHELCHCILQPLVHLAVEAANGRNVTQSEIDWFKEDVTQHFARAIYYLKDLK